MRTLPLLLLLLSFSLPQISCSRIFKERYHYKRYRVSLVFAQPERSVNWLAAFGEHQGPYYVFPPGITDTMLLLPATLSDTVALSLFSVEMERRRETGRLGGADDEFGFPTGIAVGHSAGGLQQLFIGDPGQRRISVYNDSLRFLFTLENGGLDGPQAVIELPGGKLAVFCGIRRRIIVLDRNGGLELDHFTPLSRELAGTVRLRSGMGQAFLCVDTDHDRILLVSYSSRISGQYVKAMGRFFKRPTDAMMVHDRLLVLDPGNGRIVELSRNGAGIRECNLPFLHHARFFLRTFFGFAVFDDAGNVHFLGENLEWLCSKPLSVRVDDGVTVSGGRLILVSSNGRRLCEYRVYLKQQGGAKGVAEAYQWKDK